MGDVSRRQFGVVSDSKQHRNYKNNRVNFDGFADNVRSKAVIISPSTLYCDALSYCLREEFEKNYGVFSTLNEFITSNHIDDLRGIVVIILENYFSGNSEDIEMVINDILDPSIIVIGSEDHLNHMLGIRQKVRGVIPISSSLVLALQAIRLVQYGGVFMPPEQIDHARRNQSHHNGSSNQQIGLTRTQLAVAEALRTGMSNKLIAHNLGMNEHTVKVHIRNILKRLGAKNRTEAALIISRTRNNIYVSGQ
jgi:DNA-binding NarL/FixJ family response regulator